MTSRSTTTTTIFRQLREARAFDHAPLDKRRDWVRRRLVSLLSYARENSKRYQERGQRGDQLDEAIAALSRLSSFAKFEEIEPLTKPELAKSFDALCTDPEISLAKVIEADKAHPAGDATLRTARGTYNIKKTSGTSGQIVYQVDTLATQRTVTSIVLYRALLRTLAHGRAYATLIPLPRRSRIAIFVHRGNRSVYQGATSQGAPTWAKAFFDVDIIGHDVTLDEIVATLERSKPEFVYGLPSRVEWLARAQIAGSLRIAPHLVFVGGETLPERLPQLCMNAWPGCQLVNTYGTTETKPIATACPECHELHVCEDLVHLELLREDKKTPCAPGEEAACVLATSLWNFTLPILRYQLEDRIVLLPDAGCRVKTKRIRVRGREPVFLWTQDRRSGKWRPLEGRTLSEALTMLDDVVGYQVVHKQPRELEVTVVTSSAKRDSVPAVETSTMDAVRKFVEDHGCTMSDLLDDVSVKVIDFETHNRTGGKLRSIHSTITPPSLELPRA